MPFLSRLFPFPSQLTLQQSARLRRIVDRIRCSLELKVVLQTAVDELQSLLAVDRCLFFWYFEDLQRVQVVCERIRDAHQASFLGHHPLSKFGSIASWLNADQPLPGADNPAPFWQRLGRSQSAPNRQILGATVSLLVPIQGRDGSLGFIACLSSVRRWSAAQREVVQATAQQLEIAICQAQLYERSQKQMRRERLVNRITTQTRQSLNLDTILTETIAQLLTALEVDRCLVHLVEAVPETSEAKLELSQPTPNQVVFCRKHLYEACGPLYQPSLENFDPQGPMTEWIIQHRQIAAISDITQDDRIGSHNLEYRQAEIKSSLVVPVQTDRQLQAILYLNQCSRIRYWSQEDQKLAEAVADQLAISIQQGRLYAQTQQQAIDSAAQAQSLAEALLSLRQAQAQLIQSEKMSSLGQMVAGVAHEINNPISFIAGNLPYVDRYVQDLVFLLRKYQICYPELLKDYQDSAEAIDFDFLLRDLPRTLASMKEGTKRIREIVMALRSFSCLDEAQLKPFSLAEGIDSTLSILQAKLSPEIEIVRQYGDVPLVECYPRLINQVFLNLLMNAIDAVEAIGSASAGLTPGVASPCWAESGRKRIEITTAAFTETHTGQTWARVTVSDSGCGISPEIQSKVFDPFFTTKVVGQGRGLGLAICYQTITSQHQGRLYFESQPGEGSTFVVELPLTQEDTKPIGSSTMAMPEVAYAFSRNA